MDTPRHRSLVEMWVCRQNKGHLFVTVPKAITSILRAGPGMLNQEVSRPKCHRSPCWLTDTKSLMAGLYVFIQYIAKSLLGHWSITICVTMKIYPRCIIKKKQKQTYVVEPHDNYEPTDMFKRCACISSFWKENTVNSGYL